jgi:glycosyltransferase involved in cell wall biosynthesis
VSATASSPSTEQAGPSAATAPLPISGCVIAFEEADRVAACVAGLRRLCADVVVVDNGSRDDTRALVLRGGARLAVRQPFAGHVGQKQLAVDLAKFDWVLCLDADERVTPELDVAIRALFAGGEPEASAYSMPRRNHYLGRIVRRGLFWPDRKLRLFDRRLGRWGGVNPHDRVEMDPGIATVQLPERAAIEHLSYRDFRHHLRTIDSFTAIAARELRARGRRFSWLDLAVRPPAVAVKSLLLKRGFLDGWRGFLIAAMAFYYDWLKYWRLRAAWRAHRESEAQP